MKALTLTAYKEFEFGDAPEPEVGPDDVLVGVRACGICGSDIHGMDGSSGRRIPPIIMGHEASGEVVRVGENVSGWKAGDRVGFDSVLFCGECDHCRAGETNLCDERRVIGVSCEEYRRHGAFAEYVTIPARALVAVPDGLSFEEAAFGEPVAVAMHAVNRVAPRAGETAVVVGAGLIGLLVVQALKLAGCGRVIAVDLNAGRVALATELGAEDGIVSGAGEEDDLSRVLALIGGEGADIAMEVVGIEATTELAIKCLRKGGRLGAVGNIQPRVDFALQDLVTRELSVMGSCASAGEYGRALEAIAGGGIRVKPLIGAVGALSEGGKWFEKLYKGDDGLLKVILKP